MTEPSQDNKRRKPLSEDWLAVIVAFILIVLAAIGVLGPNGINIRF